MHGGLSNFKFEAQLSELHAPKLCCDNVQLSYLACRVRSLGSRMEVRPLMDPRRKYGIGIN